MTALATTLRNTSVRRSRAKSSGSQSPSRMLLSQSDFSYQGYYIIPGDPYGTGGTHRYVSTDLRFIRLAFLGNGVPVGTNKYGIREYTFAGVNYGDTLTETNAWDELFDVAATGNDGNEQHHGIWWEEANSRLWCSSAVDYGVLSVPRVFTTRQLNSNGTTSNHHGVWGIEGIGQRALFGNVQAVPQWFQTAYSVPKYVAGWGGYTSLMAQGMTPSLGPMAVFFPDPHGVYPELGTSDPGSAWSIPASAIKIGADTRVGATASSDWFPNYSSRTFDRGSRITTDVVNWFDGSDVRPNPSSRPTYPTDWTEAGSWWTGENGGPAPNDPNGFARWVWGDSFHGTATWVDNDAGTWSRHGIILVGSFCKSYGWYEGSTFGYDGRTFEIQIFDPAEVAEVLAATRPVWALRPAHAWEVTLPGMTVAPQSGGGRNVMGATFDPVSGKLLLAGYGDTQDKNRLFVFQGPVLA